MTDKIKRGDLLPAWRVTLLNGETPVDLSAATEVRVLAWRSNALLINRVLPGPYPTDGALSMPWEAADTATAGDLLFEVQVTWPGSRPQTFPPDGYLVTRVYQDLG